MSMMAGRERHACLKKLRTLPLASSIDAEFGGTFTLAANAICQINHIKAYNIMEIDVAFQFHIFS